MCGVESVYEQVVFWSDDYDHLVRSCLIAPCRNQLHHVTSQVKFLIQEGCVNVFNCSSFRHP